MHVLLVGRTMTPRDRMAAMHIAYTLRILTSGIGRSQVPLGSHLFLIENSHLLSRSRGVPIRYVRRRLSDDAVGLEISKIAMVAPASHLADISIQFALPLRPFLFHFEFFDTWRVDSSRICANMSQPALVMPVGGDQDRGPSIEVTIWVFTSIALVTVSLRIFGRVSLTSNIGWDDFWIVVAMVKKTCSLL